MSVPELAGEDSFIRWVTKGENDQRWSHWLDQDPERTKIISEAKQIVQALSVLPSTEIDPHDKSALWTRIHHSIHHRSSSPVRKKYSLLSWSIAAAAAIALLLWINTLRGTEKLVAQAGDKREFTLPESSEVMLNADSRIIYHKANFTADRELTLKGEAFFKVKPGSSFTVKTDWGNITVLGTSFNVIARPERFEVSCHTGKVRVTNLSGQQREITAGEMVIDEKKPTLTLKEFTPAALPSWTEGKFIFNDQPLSVVFAELERQYKVRVELPADLRNMRYTGPFESGNLTNALHIITWPLILQYEVKGNTVVISK